MANYGRISVVVQNETIELSYLEIIVGNPKKAIPVIACHGLTSSKDMLAHGFLKHLAHNAEASGLNMRILAFDWPGHGLSGRAKKHSLQLLSETLYAFMNVFGIDRAHIFGMSMGGTAAMMFASRYPERIATMCVAGAPIDCRDLDAGTKAAFAKRGIKFAGYFRRLMPDDLTFISKNTLKKLAPFAVSAGSPERVKEFREAHEDKDIFAIIKRDVRNFSARACFDYIDAFLELNLLAEITKIGGATSRQTPVLLLDGASPGYRFLDTVERIYSMLDPAFTEKHIIEDAGHFAVMLKPGEAAKAYLEFLCKNASF